MIRPLFLLAALGLAMANPPPLFNCTGLSGVVWNACRSFGVCNGGRHEQIDCPMGTGFSRNQQNCVDIRQADWPCTIEMRDCSDYPRTVHRLAELESGDGRPPCSWYYTCIYGRFVAHQPCPEGMVYSEQRQNCRYQHDVEEPCGPLPRGTEGDGTGDGSNWPQNQGRNTYPSGNNNNNRGGSPNNNNNWGGSPNNNNWGGSPNNNNNNRGNTPNNNNWSGSPNNNNNQNPRNNNNNWSNPNNPNTYPSNNNNNRNNPNNPNTFPSNNNNNNDWDIFNNNNNPNNNNNQWNGGNPNTGNNPDEEDNWDGGFGGFGYAGR